MAFQWLAQASPFSSRAAQGGERDFLKAPGKTLEKTTLCSSSSLFSSSFPSFLPVFLVFFQFSLFSSSFPSFLPVFLVFFQFSLFSSSFPSFLPVFLGKLFFLLGKTELFSCVLFFRVAGPAHFLDVLGGSDHQKGSPSSRSVWLILFLSVMSIEQEEQKAAVFKVQRLHCSTRARLQTKKKRFRPEERVLSEKHHTPAQRHYKHLCSNTQAHTRIS